MRKPVDDNHFERKKIELLIQIVYTYMEAARGRCSKIIQGCAPGANLFGLRVQFFAIIISAKLRFGAKSGQPAPLSL